MAERRLLVFGVSGHGRVVVDAARAAGWTLIGWADDDRGVRGQVVADAPVLATGVDEAARTASEAGAAVLIAIGNPWARQRVFAALLAAGNALATVVHPSAVLATSVQLGAGTVVMAGAVLNPDAVVGVDCIINTMASVDHDCRLGAHVHLSPGVHLGGTVVVGEGTHVGIGACVRNNLRIGAWSLVGAGAAVVSDLPDGVVAYGVPARVVRENRP